MTDETSLSANDSDAASFPGDAVVLPPDPAVVDSISAAKDESNLTSVAQSMTDVAAPSNDSPRWYFGIGESLLWFLGTLVVHLVGGIATLIAGFILMTVLAGGTKVSMDNPRLMMIATAGEMTLFVLAAIVCVSVRYWGRTFTELNLSRPELKHVAIVVAGTLPLSYCVSAYSMPIQWGWNLIAEQFPGLKWLDQLSAMEMVKDMASTTSLPMMILVLAVLPAIGEELVFRGAIGRVLIASLGLWGGVALTSFLFGWIHVHPVHALSVVPLGIAIHLVYLWTRSFWMPMLLHFVNNCWASVTAQFGTTDPLQQGTSVTLIDLVGIVSALIAVTALMIALSQSRVRFIRPDGSEWTSPRYPLHVPTTSAACRCSAPISASYWGTGFGFAAVCHLIMGWQLWNTLMTPH